jgi:hypothetical protein
MAIAPFIKADSNRRSKALDLFGPDEFAERQHLGTSGVQKNWTNTARLFGTVVEQAYDVFGEDSVRPFAIRKALGRTGLTVGKAPYSIGGLKRHRVGLHVVSDAVVILPGIYGEEDGFDFNLERTKTSLISPDKFEPVRASLPAFDSEVMFAIAGLTNLIEPRLTKQLVVPEEAV